MRNCKIFANNYFLYAILAEEPGIAQVHMTLNEEIYRNILIHFNVRYQIVLHKEMLCVNAIDFYSSELLWRQREAQ